MRHSFFSKAILLSPSLWLGVGATLWVAGCSWSDARETMIGEPAPRLGTRHAPMLNPGGSTNPTTSYDDEGGDGVHPWDRNRPAPNPSASASSGLFATSGDGRHPWDKDSSAMRAAAPNTGLMGMFNPPAPPAPAARHVPVENQSFSTAGAPTGMMESAGTAEAAPVEKVSAMPERLPSRSASGKYPALSSVPQGADEIAGMKQTQSRAKANAADLKRERTLADSARTEFGPDSEGEGNDEAEEKLSLPRKPGAPASLPADLPPPSRAMSAPEEAPEQAPAKRGMHWPWSKAESAETPPAPAASGARSPWSGPEGGQDIPPAPPVKAAEAVEPIHLRRPGSGGMEPIRLHSPYALNRTLPESRYAARRRAQASHSESPF